MDMLSFPPSEDDNRQQALGHPTPADTAATFTQERGKITGLEQHAPRLPHMPIEDEDDLMDGVEDTDMAGLIDGMLAVSDRVPPPSVIRDADADSREGTQFDRSLQHSTPATSPTTGLKTPIKPVDLLDEDVDWDTVMTIADHSSIAPLDCDNIRDSGKEATVISPDHTTTLPPFVRPPLPPKLCDRPVIVGVASDSLLRICFRIGELLNLNAQCQRAGQQATFELFARVTYSNREEGAKTQHFQFKDLFSNCQPYPTGTLKNWRLNSMEDYQAKLFLEGKDRMCRVIVRMKKEQQHRVALGWVLDILSIRETSWDEVQWVRRIIARDDPECPAKEG